MPSQSAATLRSRYVEQAASDLEKNRQLQQELARRLDMLKQEEALLVDILTLAERYEGFLGEAPLPRQKRQEAALVGNTTRDGAGDTSRKRPPARQAKAAGGPGAKEKPRRPLLGDVLAELLGEYTEPRLAKELRDELLEKHTDLAPTPQVVRNTLESLVAKGRIVRHKQQRSVMYTLVESAPKEKVAD